MSQPQLSALFILASFFLLPFSAQGKMMGFSPESAAAQQTLEAQLNADNLNEWMKHMAAHPHHVGWPWGKQNAEFMAARFRKWGFETEIETFQVLFPTPKLRLLELLEPTPYRAGLAEPPVAGDAHSAQTDEMLPP